jgi:hypothetical protein
VSLGIWARQRAFTKQMAVGLRQRGSREKFAVIAAKSRAKRRLAHLEPQKAGDAPHHKAWQGRSAGRFGMAAAGQPARRNRWHGTLSKKLPSFFRDPMRGGSTMPLSGVAASMDRFPSRS